MEYTQFINEFYPLSTKLGDNPTFKTDRVKEIKGYTSANVEIDGITAERSIKVLKVTKAKVELHKTDVGDKWHFHCKAVLRLND